jgi:hypothetical protein
LLVAHQQQHDVDADWMGPQNAHVREYGSSWSMNVLIFRQRTLTFFTHNREEKEEQPKQLEQ